MGSGKPNSVACGNNKQCVFYTADSTYPGLVGCCDDNDPTSCLYETTCYDAAAMSATPDLTSSSFTGGTSILPSTYTGYYYDEYPTVAAVSPSLVDDDWIKAYASGAAATASTDKTAKATSAATAPASSDTSNKGSSTNTAAIIGGVVGGVVGAGGIGAAIFMFWMLQKKKKKQHNEDAATGASQPALGGIHCRHTLLVLSSLHKKLTEMHIRKSPR
ncbi:hypothetical protein N7451_002480 [Penicillium sp. IBT 35674x]|nr:hypothetical protein N7451_002480 [Penicillium sp. IBT 35674x]